MRQCSLAYRRRMANVSSSSYATHWLLSHVKILDIDDESNLGLFSGFLAIISSISNHAKVPGDFVHGPALLGPENLHPTAVHDASASVNDRP